MARITGGLAIAAGVGTLFGWAFGVDTLFRVAAGLAPMKPNTALNFILCGLAVLLRTAQGDPRDGQADKRARRLGGAAAVLAAIAALIGALTLTEHLTGLYLGLDTWIFGDALHSDGITPAGRMTPAAALNFVLLGGALALIDWEPGRGVFPAQHAGLVVSLSGLIAVLGYLYGLHSLYNVFVYSTMALHTALTFFLIGLGVMMIRPTKGLMAVATNSYSGGAMARRLLPAAVLLPAAIGWLRLQGELAGWYDGRFGLALFASSNIITFVVLLWFSARSLNRADAQRRRAHEALRASARGLREANERLQAEINEHRRTEQARQRTERQLHQSQKMESLGTLAGGIAHDFNNILTAIFLNADRARKQLPDHHAARESLAEISRAGTRAADLVRRIMAFGRQTEPDLKTLRLREAVEDSLRLLSLSLPSNVTLVTDLEATVPPVSADATQVHQILLNLGNNALQAMNPGGGTLTVKLETVGVTAALASQLGVAAGSYVRLVVADTGLGMEKGVLDRIFEPFFTTKTTGEGTGLGLSVVHGIMELHGGCVTAYSEPGRGALFHLYFPAVTAVDDEPESNAVGALPRGDGARILCVDDDPSVMKACADLLEDLGYTVTSFEDPRLAREEFRLRPHDFDLVLTDYTMPGLSGVDLARELRLVRADLPVVLSSGYMATAEIAKAQEAGIVAFVQKPALPEELGTVLAAALRRSRQGDA